MQIAYLTVIYNNYKILNKNLKLVNSQNIDITYYIIDNSDKKNKNEIHRKMKELLY